MARKKKDPARLLIERLLRSHHRELLRKEEAKLVKKSRNVMKRDIKELNEFFFGGGRVFEEKAK
jgi:hypothetical protein